MSRSVSRSATLPAFLPPPGLMTGLSTGLMTMLVALLVAVLPVRGQDLPSCSSAKELCVRAERSGDVDLKTGTAQLEGNVAGTLHSQGLDFHAQRLSAFRGEGERWSRLVLEQEVRLSSNGREMTGDRAEIEGQTITLTSSDEDNPVRVSDSSLSDGQFSLTAARAVLTREPQRLEAEGSSASPVHVLLPSGSVVWPQSSANSSVPDDTAERAPTEVSAQHMLLLRDQGRAEFSGSVHLSRGGAPEERFDLRADRLELDLDADLRVNGLSAQGDVRLEQPGRSLSAHSVRGRDRLETLLLEGAATVRQEGQFDLSSERMEVYTDAGRGSVRAAEPDKPITLSLDMDDGAGYRLDGAALHQLAQGKTPTALPAAAAPATAVPSETVERLATLLGRDFRNRETFSAALGEVLSTEEMRLHASAIYQAARKKPTGKQQ